MVCRYPPLHLLVEGDLMLEGSKTTGATVRDHLGRDAIRGGIKGAVDQPQIQT
jgi:hypothetical protein